MNKEQLQKSLNNRLDIFTDEVKKEEIESVLNQVKTFMESGKTESDAIKELGNINDIVNKIYLKHGININKLNNKKDFFYKKFEDLFNVIHHVIDVASKNDFQNNMKIVFDIVILLGFICILKIPFILIRNLGDSLILDLNIPYFSNIWGLIIDLIYIIIAIMFFINIFTKYFKNLESTKNKPIKKEALESINLEEK